MVIEFKQLIELVDTINPSLKGAIVGGLITGLFTLLAVKSSYKKQLDLQVSEQNRMKANVISAIYFEIVLRLLPNEI